MKALPLLFLACWSAPKVDAKVDGWEIDYGGHERCDSEVDVTLRTVRSAAPCSVDLVFGGAIEFKNDDFVCLSAGRVHGCQPRPMTAAANILWVGYVRPIWKSALIDETGHLIW